MSNAGVSMRNRAGLTDKQAAILDSLSGALQMTTAEIADDTGYPGPSDLSCAMTVLAERGLVSPRATRVLMSSRGERRHASWAVTDAGRAALQAWEAETRADLDDARVAPANVSRACGR